MRDKDCRRSTADVRKLARRKRWRGKLLAAELGRSNEDALSD